MAVANTITYETLFESVLQDRLDHPQTWKELCDVQYTDTRVMSTSYISVANTPAVQTVTRGTGVALQTFTETAETMTISTGRDLGILLDWADKAQSPWSKPAELLDRIGHLLNEFIETQLLAQHASFTNFGVGDITGGTVADTTQITVSAANIDDIIRGVKRVIRVANGQTFMAQNGVGFAWRPADFEILEAFIQANGFMTADAALKAGTVEGLKYMAVDHYWTNDFAANHVFATVKKLQRVGVLRGTYGRAHTIDFPAADSNTFFSGQAYYSRVDVGFLTPSGYASLILDVNVV